MVPAARSIVPHEGTIVRRLLLSSAVLSACLTAAAQQPPAPPPAAPTRANILRGEYGRYRANNDVQYYHLDIRIDPEKKLVAGKNTVRFKMLADDTRIQLDLYANLNIDKITLGATPLKYERELNAVFVDFPETLKTGRTYSIDFHYSGTPTQTGRFGGFTFGKDPAGRHWIFTACEGEGASIWWPNKDQWRDEAETMDISVAIPSDLTDVSNGRFLGKTDVGGGYTRWDWRVHYPINSYNVSVNIGRYEHFSDRLGDLSLDFYVQPESLDKAKRQFVQAKPMIEAFKRWFGEYPFPKDGYKLIEVPYSGMEHQSAVTYGNRFANGYLERDWTGVGVSLKFDFIIIHESAHEWFGNAVSAADVSDMWIQEGWATYLESLYVEHVFGYDDALKYTNGYKSKVQNRTPIITPRGLHRTPPQDQYFKGALMLHTLRNVVNDDRRWARLLRDVYREFRYRNIMTEDFVRFVNRELGQDLTPFFNQYLRRTAIPTLELRFDDAARTVSYRWQAEEPGFAMPVRVGAKSAWQTIRPTSEWQTMPTGSRRTRSRSRRTSTSSTSTSSSRATGRAPFSFSTTRGLGTLRKLQRPWLAHAQFRPSSFGTIPAIRVPPCQMAGDDGKVREVAVVRLEERVAVLEGALREQAGMMAGIREAIVSLEERIDRRLEGLEQRMDRRFESIDQRFVGIDQRFVSIDQRFVAIDQRFVATDLRIDALDAKVSRQFMWLVGLHVTTLVAIVVALAAR